MELVSLRENPIAEITETDEGWTATCEEIANMTLFPQADSWIFGANIPGRKNAVMFYMAGIGAYRQQLAEVAAAGYKGFETG
ncbi:hypothetical protein [Pseudonocardia xishanensis]|uniref:Uncharacterized protein n=1 Tax=Pseudonocardia xishanensis TaxID=630995 RepID=A0ABP8S2G8_9PSEU